MGLPQPSRAPSQRGAPISDEPQGSIHALTRRCKSVVFAQLTKMRQSRSTGAVRAPGYGFPEFGSFARCANGGQGRAAPAPTRIQTALSKLLWQFLKQYEPRYRPKKPIGQERTESEDHWQVRGPGP